VAQPWRGDPEAARYIREEQRVCQEAGIEGLVVHLPKLPPDVVLRHAGAILEPGAPDVQLYLETPATRPAESLYETPAKLAALFRALRAALPDLAPRFGLCVDTAHLSTSGVDLRSRAAAEAWLAALEAEADAFPRVMLHLNDSLRPLGVGPDAHAPLAEGKMWEAYRSRLDESGLAAFVEWARRRGAPTILERKPREALRRDYLTLRKLLPPPEPEPEPEP
jgi:sugar phosphate isomerase/epimerase